MTLRETNIDRLQSTSFDVFIVGSGINGAVAAAALAGRGAQVALIDRGDFSSFTSQESSNLVWGGFKYLEHYELPLVRRRELVWRAHLRHAGRVPSPGTSDAPGRPPRSTRHRAPG